MIISEFIEVLKAQNPNSRILATWEGILVSIDVSNIYAAHGGKVVLIDADENSYKTKWSTANWEDELRRLDE